MDRTSACSWLSPSTAAGGLRCQPRLTPAPPAAAGRLFVLPSFPRNVRALAFYAVLDFKLPAAILACCRDGLDLGILPPVTIFARPYRCPASGFWRYSSVGKPSLEAWTDASAILLEECKHPQICAKPPSCTPKEKEKSSNPGIACCVSLKMEQTEQNT